MRRARKLNRRAQLTKAASTERTHSSGDQCPRHRSRCVSLSWFRRPRTYRSRSRRRARESYRAIACLPADLPRTPCRRSDNAVASIQDRSHDKSLWPDIRSDHRPESTKGVEILGPNPLRKSRIFVDDIFRCHIVHASVSEYERVGFVGADFLASSANNNPELSFVSDSACIRSGSPDRCAWIAERSLGFKEVKRLLRRRHAELGAKFTEIVPEGDHL
jgi:hypothetical protein